MRKVRYFASLSVFLASPTPLPSPTTALNPDDRPLSTYKTEMAVRTGKCSILTILRENRELRTVYFCLVLFLLDLLCGFKVSYMKC